MTAYTPRIDAVLKHCSQGRVLHIGCTGSKLRHVHEPSTQLHGALLQHCASVVGADIDRSALAELEAKGMAVVYMDAQNIPAGGEQYDHIVAGELIEHLENPGLFLSGAKELLKPGGSLILTTPNAFCPVYWVKYAISMEGVSNPEHTCWYDAQTLGQLMRRTGWSIDSLEFVDNIGIRRYRILPAVLRLIGRLLPDKFLSTMVIVASPSGALISEQ